MKKTILMTMVLILATLGFFVLQEKSQPVPPAPAIPSSKTVFILEKSQQLHDLQAELDTRFPAGSSAKKLHTTLVRMPHVFTTGSLVKDFSFYGKMEDWKLTPATTTGESYFFYYRPLHPSGEEGWEDTHTGWAIKATVENQKKLIKTEALSVPDMQSSNKETPEIAYVKELLALIKSRKPVKQFKEDEWLALAENQMSSPCRKDISDACFAHQAFTLVGLPDAPLRFTYYKSFGNLAVQSNDKEMALQLLNVWPTEEKVRAYHNGMSRMIRIEQKSIDYDVAGHEALRAKLFFTAGKMEEGKKALAAVQERWKEGIDYQAIANLTLAGKLNEAYDVAQMVLTWPRSVPDANINSSAIMHCENYAWTRPKSMGHLAAAFIEKGNLDKARNVIEMLRIYRDGKAFGQQSFCYTNDAVDAYVTSQLLLLEKMKALKKDAEAAEIFKTLISHTVNDDKVYKTKALEVYKSLCRTGAKYGYNQEVKVLKEALEQHQNTRLRRSDPQLVAYAHCELHKNIEDRLAELPAEQQLQHYTDLTFALLREKNEKAATYYAESALKNAPDIDFTDAATALLTIQNKVSMANILQKEGKSAQRKEVLEEILPHVTTLDALGVHPIWRKKAAFAELSLLHAYHAPIKEVLAWASNLSQPYFYSHSKITNMLIEKGDMAELDLYVQTAFEQLKDKESSAKTYQRSLFVPLLKENLDSRYPALQKALVNPSRKNEKYYLDRLKEIRNQEELDEKEVARIWPNLFNNCDTDILRLFGYEYNKKPHAHEVMAACYLNMR